MTTTAEASTARQLAITQAAETQYRTMKQHYGRCPLCNPQYECIQGIKLRGAWEALDNMTEANVG